MRWYLWKSVGRHISNVQLLWVLLWTWRAQRKGTNGRNRYVRKITIFLLDQLMRFGFRCCKEHKECYQYLVEDKKCVREPGNGMLLIMSGNVRKAMRCCQRRLDDTRAIWRQSALTVNCQVQSAVTQSATVTLNSPAVFASIRWMKIKFAKEEAYVVINFIKCIFWWDKIGSLFLKLIGRWQMWCTVIRKHKYNLLF